MIRQETAFVEKRFLGVGFGFGCLGFFVLLLSQQRPEWCGGMASSPRHEGHVAA